MKKYLLIIALPLLWLACKKEPQPIAKSTQLREGPWHVADVQAKYYDSLKAKDTVINFYKNVFDSCIRDNQLQFGTNYNGLQLLKGLACNANEPTQEPFRWELVNNETGLNLYGIYFVYPLQPNIYTQIVRWDDSKIYLTFNTVQVNNDNIGDTIRYSMELVK